MMDNMFVANAVMMMSAQQQMMWHQRMDMYYLDSRHQRFSYAEQMRDEDAPNIIYRKGHEPHYAENTFGAVPEPEPMFDDREVIDMQNNRILCYIKVAIKDEISVEIQCEVKKGYMFEEDIEEIIEKQIFSALRNGYINISAVIGQYDEIAEEILKKMGFETKENQAKCREE